eukprot:Hpha_TRINITY_DN6456_c0_g1::TRINITY_DN6456_c0_g1_i1::g.237::m.237
MAGLLIFAEIHPECAGPQAGEGRIPVELNPMAAVEDIVVVLRGMDALSGTVKVEWGGTILSDAALLADVGLGQQTVVQIVRGLTEEEIRAQEVVRRAVLARRANPERRSRPAGGSQSLQSSSVGQQQPEKSCGKKCCLQ